MGNSEVGHQNIGAGRVVDQEIVRINKGIKTGSIKSSSTLNAAFDNVKAQVIRSIFWGFSQMQVFTQCLSIFMD